MATYKLMQDIEAEDHILGPLSLRQFIFALVGAFLYYLCFLFITKGVAFLLVIVLPPALFCTFFAFPFGRDQPTEIWALAKLRFLFKPRQRIWNQSGVKEMVTITVPKKVERVLTNGLSQTEVSSRLKALASTIDTRGWAIKHVDSNAYGAGGMVYGSGSDRLIDVSNLPQEVQADNIGPADDIMDAASNPVAQQFDSLVNQSSQQRHQQLLAQATADDAVATDGNGQPAPVADPSSAWFMGQSNQSNASGLPFRGQEAGQGAQASPVGSVSDQAEYTALTDQIKTQAHSQQASYGNLRTVQPLGSQSTPQSLLPDAAVQPMTTPSDPAIISLSKNNDFDVATLAREAQKAKDNDQSQDEVVIALH